MPEEQAFKAITLHAAEIIGVADRVGSLEVGKDADIVILDGHPFDYRTQVELVLVDGEVAYQRGQAVD
jgi:imidazolonepropionase-like amidohydrolase